MSEIRSPLSSSFSSDHKEETGLEESTSSSGLGIGSYTFDESVLLEYLASLKPHLNTKLTSLSEDSLSTLQELVDDVNRFSSQDPDYERMMKIIYREVNIKNEDLKPFTVASLLIGCKSNETCNLKCLGSLVKPGGKLCKILDCTVTGLAVYYKDGKKYTCIKLSCSNESSFCKARKHFTQKYGKDIAFFLSSSEDTETEGKYFIGCGDDDSDYSTFWKWLIGIGIAVIIIVIIVAIVKKNKKCIQC